MAPVKLLPVINHCLLIRRQGRQFATFSQSLDYLGGHAGGFSGGGMGVPNVLAVHLAGGDQHGQLLNLLGQGRFFPQVLVQGRSPFGGFRHVDRYGAGPIGRGRP